MRRIRDWCIDPVGDPHGWRDALLDARLPSRYWSASVDAIGYEEITRWLTETLASAKTWMSRGVGHYIHGHLNSGKSSIAAILMMDAIRRCETCLWLPVRDVPGVRFRETQALSEIADRMESCDMLVLDDLGAEQFRLLSAAGNALETAARIMYDRRRPLIITSNIQWSKFPSRYAEMPGFVSVVQRIVVDTGIMNSQWPRRPGGGL